MALNINVVGLNLVQTIPRHQQAKRLIAIAVAGVDGLERSAGRFASQPGRPGAAREQGLS